MSDKTKHPLAIKVDALYQEMGKVIIGYKDQALAHPGADVRRPRPAGVHAGSREDPHDQHPAEDAIAGAESGRIQFNPT